MSKTLKRFLIIVVILVVIGLVVYFRLRNLRREAGVFQIGTIWQANSLKSNNFDLDFSNASARVKNGRRGFEKGLATNPVMEEFGEITIPEQFGSHLFTEEIAELLSGKDVLLTVGATSDEMTMNASMLMNYFSIPLLIPFADGDLSPEDTPVNYSIRMTPTAQKYTEFIGELFSPGYFSIINNYFFQDVAIPDYDMNTAVFFANNFNGHNTAVSITQKIIDNGYNVEIYAPYEQDAEDLEFLIQSLWQSDPDKMNSIDSVVIIGEDGASMRGLSAVNQSWKNRGMEPLIFLIGFLPDDIEADVIDARNVYNIQQALDMEHCPPNITNRSEAMGYAAGYIVSSALYQARQKQPSEASGLSLFFSSEDSRREKHQDYLTSYRENVRSVLLDMNESIPCYGPVNFDINSDSNIEIELVRYTSSTESQPVGSGIMLDYIIDKVRKEFNLPN